MHHFNPWERGSSEVQISFDLVHWNTIGEIALEEEAGSFTDPTAPASPMRYYRVVQSP